MNKSPVEMECNKDEAIRVKEVAEKKLTEKDISAAKRLAYKAQSLFPELEGLSQFLEVVDIYAASEKKVNEEVDLYEILGVNPLDDVETIRKRYRRLALALHPDKNKAVGADGAFKILSEAWSLLSDKAKRAAYDEKRKKMALYQVVTGQNLHGGVEKHGGENFTNKASTARVFSTPANPQTDFAAYNTNNFWTQCTSCKMHYQYLAIYRNQNLLCPNCSRPFLATEMPAPPVNCHHAFTPWFHHQQHQAGHPASSESGRQFRSIPSTGPPVFSGFGLNSRANFTQGSPFRCDSSRSMSTSVEAAAQPAYPFQPMGEKLKRGHEEAVSGNVSISGRHKPAKKRCTDEHKASVGGKDTVNQIPQGSRGNRRGNSSGNQKGRFAAEKVIISDNQPKSLRELSQSETRDMLMQKAKIEIHKKLQGWNMAAPLKSAGEAGREAEEKSASVNAPKESAGSGILNARNMSTSTKDAKKSSLSSVTTFSGTAANTSTPNPEGLKESSLSASTAGSNTEAIEIKTMDVPDPEFYNFDKDRIEESFAENQVWAVYDNEDGMPRFYAIVHEVISRKPFRIRISWLNSKTNSEFGPLNWVGCGFTKTCGNFRRGKHEVNKTLNSFSHRVKWTKGAKGVIQIFPKKGDVWAIYRNWSSEWNEFTPDNVIHQYDMVEVLQDYNEEQGVAVASLVKVAGFRSVFHQHSDTRKIYTIPREEMFRFSHQVASYLIIGQEAQTAPRGCRELDTAAMPLELLHLVEEAKEGESGKTADKVSATGDVDAAAMPSELLQVVKELEGGGKTADKVSATGDVDAAAMPLELLQVVKEAEGGGTTANYVSATGNAGTMLATGGGKHVVRKQLLVYTRRAKGKKVAGDSSRDKEETRSAGAHW